MVDSRLEEIKTKLNKLQGKRDLLIEQRNTADKEKIRLEAYYENALKARAVIQTVAETTQKRLEFCISSLVTTALAGIFPDPYAFLLRFVKRRNKTEADLVFSKRGNETDDIKSTAGGGVVDMSSIALIFAVQSISGTTPIVFMDEPAKFLSSNLQEKASSMIKFLSDKSKLQIIMISHLPHMIAAADKVIRIENFNGVASIGEGNYAV